MRRRGLEAAMVGFHLADGSQHRPRQPEAGVSCGLVEGEEVGRDVLLCVLAWLRASDHPTDSAMTISPRANSGRSRKPRMSCFMPVSRRPACSSVEAGYDIRVARSHLSHAHLGCCSSARDASVVTWGVSRRHGHAAGSCLNL
jgi:hypothetical protein